MSGGQIWLRVAIYQTRGSAYQASVDYLTAGIAEFTRVLKNQPGFIIAYWGIDPDDTTIAAVSHWRSLAAIHDAEPELVKLQAGAAAHGIHLLRVQSLHLFPIPVAVTMWATDPDDQADAARTRHRFRLHR